MNRILARVLALSLSLGLIAGPVLAQGNGGRRGTGFLGAVGGFSLLRLPAPVLARLEPTDEQKQKLTALRERIQTEVQALLSDAQFANDRQAAIEKLRSLNDKVEAEAVALLSPKQKQQADALKAEAAQYAGLGPSGIAMLAVTGLTDDQKAKLKDVALRTQGKRQELFQTLQGGGDRQAAIQALRAQGDEANVAVKQILNAEQQKQFQEALPMGRRPGNQN
jgi:hypothetical protein